MTNNHEIRAEMRLHTTNLRADLGLFDKKLGIRLDSIYSGHGLRVRLETRDDPVAHLCIMTDDLGFAGGVNTLTAPGGTQVDVAPLNPPLELPTIDHAFVVRRLADQAPWVIGRAGMQYRDLIPSRLGGSIVASHIRIPDRWPCP